MRYWSLVLPLFLTLDATAAARDLDSIGEEVSSAPVALVADEVIYDQRTGVVTASGNVEVFQGERTLTAPRLIYDSQAGRISAEGPIVLRDPSGTTVLADAADIDGELRDGIIDGARAVIAAPDGGGGTLAAVQGQRIEGRYNVLSRAVYSPCEVCLAQPTPLWQIRARHIVHDQEERMVHYEGAIFDVMGVPVAYLPFFSHPDPTVERKTGFLTPTFSRASTYGFAAQIPYFIALDESRDITLTAFPTSSDGPIWIAEYRQAFDIGRIRFEGSFGNLDTDPDGGRENRGHLFGDGQFSLDEMTGISGLESGFELELTSDDAYLSRYGFSDADRLESVVYLETYGQDNFFRLSGTGFESLRDDEPDGDRLFALPEFNSRFAFDLGDMGGEGPFGNSDLGRLGIEASSLFLSRPDGRDVARLSLGGDWAVEQILPVGLAVGAFAETRMDAYWVNDDPDFDEGAAFRLYPQVGVEARYPLIGTLGTSTHLIEPIAQFIFAPDDIDSGDIPNEDSQTVEFNDANLFSSNRFPGFDRVETGTRFNVGMRYARIAPDRFTLDGSIGRVFRLDEDGAFSEGSGLAPQQSDYVAALNFGFAPWVAFANSVRVDEDFRFNRAEVEGILSLDRARLAASYVFLGDDAQANRFEDEAAFNATATVDLTRNWQIGGRLRQDLEEDETVLLAGRLAYRTECATLEIFVDRDFPDRRTEERETSVGFRVQLFGVSQPEQRRGGCGTPSLGIAP